MKQAGTPWPIDLNAIKPMTQYLTYVRRTSISHSLLLVHDFRILQSICNHEYVFGNTWISLGERQGSIHESY